MRPVSKDMPRLGAKILKRCVGGVALLWALPLLALVVTDLRRPETPPLPAPADAIICLGAGMSYRGWHLPGPASTRRARSCAELYHAEVAPVILFTGAGHDRGSAAEAMARLTQADGVPEAAILLEHEARSTLQNAAFSLALLPAGTDRVVIVTDAFHIPRSWMVFHVLGAPDMAFYPARDIYTTEDGPRARSRTEWLLRESVVIWTNLGRVLIYLAASAIGLDAETPINWFN